MVFLIPEKFIFWAAVCRGKVPHTHQIVFYLFTKLSIPNLSIKYIAATSADLPVTLD